MALGSTARALARCLARDGIFLSALFADPALLGADDPQPLVHHCEERERDAAIQTLDIL